ncbi:MAG: hypothetical protein SFY95_11500 [Planctomycetota bacterium]|nr:hypothetical protein [Planctomycetota bacterium]
MLATLAVLWRVVVSPIWALWRGYLALWWAFDDASILGLRAKPTPAPTPVPGPVDQPAPAAVSAQRPAEKPLRLLKTGFALSLASSLALAWLAGVGASQAWMSESGAWMFWAWGSIGSAVTSILAVRQAHRKELARKAASLPHRFARAVKQGAAVAPQQVGQTIGKVGQACAVGAKSAFDKAKPHAASLAQRSIAQASAWWRSAGAKQPQPTPAPSPVGVAAAGPVHAHAPVQSPAANL